VDRKRHRSPDTGTLHTLVVVECPPLGTAIYEISVNDETATLADQFCPFIVMDELSAPALRADRFGMIFCLFLGLFSLRA